MNRIDSYADKLDSIFEQFDEDGSGFLDRIEVVELLNDIADDMGLPPLDENHISELMRIMDENGDNEITFDELKMNYHHVARILKQKYHSKSLATCRKIFVMFNRGEGETLKKQQIKTLCHYLADQIGVRRPLDHEVDNVIEIMDDNGDQEISFSEFKQNIDAVNKYIEENGVKSKIAGNI